MTGGEVLVQAGAIALAIIVLLLALVRLAFETRTRRKQYKDLHMRSLAMRWHHELLEHRVSKLEHTADEVIDRLRHQELRP